MRVAYRHIRPIAVVYARSTGAYQAAANDAWERLNAWVNAHYVRRQVKRGFGLFHDNPRTTSPELLRYDACIELATAVDADPEAGIGRQTLSGGTYAVHVHVGAYERMGELLSQLHREWVPKQGLAVDYDRPFMTIHLNDPQMTREVHRRTELCIPVLPLRTALPAETTGELEDFALPQLRRVVGLK
ncbi:MAG: GyrI-like domain-containing protein [Hyphomonadaceae bacterium]|nr:GyrI-like domain-containing protein [Hyphomonadaceae bacterium]